MKRRGGGGGTCPYCAVWRCVASHSMHVLHCIQCMCSSRGWRGVHLRAHLEGLRAAAGRRLELLPGPRVACPPDARRRRLAAGPGSQRFPALPFRRLDPGPLTALLRFGVAGTDPSPCGLPFASGPFRFPAAGRLLPAHLDSRRPARAPARAPPSLPASTPCCQAAAGSAANPQHTTWIGRVRAMPRCRAGWGRCGPA